MTILRGADDWNELRFCHVIGGAWRVPMPGGLAADLARAMAAARPIPGLRLPPAQGAALAGLPALIRPGAAILLADAARAEAAVHALSQWLHDCPQHGHDPAALSLIQPVGWPLAAGVAQQQAGWQLIPLFSDTLL